MLSVVGAQSPVATAADALFLVVAAVMVVLLAAGATLFYGGIARTAGATGLWRRASASAGVTALVWVLVGYGAVFGSPLAANWLGNPFSEFALLPLTGTGPGNGIDSYRLALAAFQGTVAVAAVSFLTAGVGGGVRLGSWLIFVVLWVTFGYLPVAHWVFDIDGWPVSVLGVRDFAGASVVHLNVGATALALTLVLGRTGGAQNARAGRSGTPLTVLGGVALWFGWFGFDAGAEAALDSVTGLIWLNTLAASAAAAIAWLIVEKFLDKKTTVIGAVSGAVSGLVAVSAACDILTPGWSLVLGAFAGGVCAVTAEKLAASRFRAVASFVGIHLTGGAIGMLYLGIFGTGIGFIDSGSIAQVATQAVTVLGITVYSFAVAWLLGTGIEKAVGLRVAPTQQTAA